MTILSGCLKKMRVEHNDPVSYQLPVGEHLLELNPLLGQSIKLSFQGKILCTHCGRKSKKSFNQGYCYPCFQRLAACDRCIMSPEHCHYHQGTCREPEWGETHCMIEHVVYLANSSGLKVGITRHSQVPTRWIDQGAVAAIPLYRVNSRLLSGLLEHRLREVVSDRTSWQAMLKGQVLDCDLAAERSALYEHAAPVVKELRSEHGDLAVVEVSDDTVTHINYPVLEHPKKVKAHNFDKQAEIEGKLMGIKGQYLILDTGVLNIRKFTAYEVAVELS